MIGPGIQGYQPFDPNAQLGLVDPRYQGMPGSNPAADLVSPMTATTPADPYVWGAGGQRMTPDEIDAQRKIAEAQMQGGMDYSPVGSWAQGLARVAQGLLGGLEERKLDKADKANAAENQDIGTQLMAGGGKDPNAIIRALLNPYASPTTKTVAGLLLKANEKPEVELGPDEKLLAASGLVPGTPAYQAAARSLFDRKSDPIVTVSLGEGRIYNGPQSGLMSAFTGGGGQPSAGSPGAAPSPPATLPPDFDFGAGGPKQPASGTFR